MTVGELREVLSHAPDDTPVRLCVVESRLDACDAHLRFGVHTSLTRWASVDECVKGDGVTALVIYA